MRLRWSLVALALIGAACGSEDTASPTPTSESATTTSAAQPATTESASATTIPLVPVDPEEVSGRGGGSTTTSADPATTQPPRTAPAPTDPPADPSIPATTFTAGEAPTLEVVGPGRPQWFSTDGNTVVVAGNGEGYESPNCEGFVRPVLQRLPLNGAPSTVAVLGENGATGTLARPDDGKVGLLDFCDSAITTVWVADEAPNGLMARAAAIPVSQPTAFLGPFTPTLDGSAFLVSTVGDGSSEASVVSIDARTGAVATLFPGQYAQISELADGGYVGLTWDREVRWVDTSGSLVDAVAASAYAVSPTGDRIAMVTDDHALVLSPADPSAARTRIDLPGAGNEAFGVWKLAMVNDGVALTRQSANPEPVWLATSDGDLVELIDADEWGKLVASDDGSLLATSRPIADPDDLFAEETVVVRL